MDKYLRRSLIRILAGAGSSLVMVAAGVLHKVASLIGATLPVIRFLVHLVISTLVGMNYGTLFRREAPNAGSGVAWELLHGLIRSAHQRQPYGCLP